MKRKENNGMYLLNTDIKELHKRYSELYKDVKNDGNLSDAQRDRECEVLLAKYNFEIEVLNALREVEYKTQQAKIEARDKEEAPWRGSWLRSLLFMPVTNRAQDIIEKEAVQNADERFTAIENELEARADKFDSIDTEKLSQRERKKLLKKCLKNKHLLEVALQAISKAAPPSEASTVANTKKAAAEQLEEIIKAADNTEPGEAFEQPEPPATVQPSEAPAAQPPAEPSEAPSEPPAEQPQVNKNARRNRKKKRAEQPPTEPLALQEVSTDIGAQMRLPIP